MKPTKLPQKRSPLIFIILLFVFFGLQAQTKSLVVIDSEFSDKQQVISSLSSNEILLELSNDSNPWKKIRETLEANKDLTTMHLFANTTYNSIRIGGITYDEAKVNQEFELSMLEGLYQGENIELLLYNCNLGSNEEGLNLINNISQRAYFNIGVCTSCTSIFEAGFSFSYTSLNKPIITSPITLN